MMGRTYMRTDGDGMVMQRSGILGRRSFYYSPATTAVRNNEVLFEVRAPEKAEIWFEGKKTEQTGTIRQYVSTGLTPGQKYTYELKAKWMEDGKEKVETRNIEVAAGQFKTIDLSKQPAEKLKPTPQKN